jgi:hypothetical protein
MHPVLASTDWWPPVLSGLGGALIVGLIGVGIARDERDAADKRHAEQLTAAGDRLDRQLAQDREMRDLQHLRETLTPIVARALNWDAWVSFSKALHDLASNYDRLSTETWEQVVGPLAAQVGEISEHVRRDGRSLIVILGPTSPVVTHLRAIGDGGSALVSLAARWKEAGERPPTFENDFTTIVASYERAHARLLEAANDAVGWGPMKLSEPEPDVPGEAI